jgi:outer membrane murein-binding lipoprotein Lpp
MAEASKAQIRAEQLINKLWHDGEIGAKLQNAAASMFEDVKPDATKYAPVVAPLQSKVDKLEKDLAAEREARAKEAAARDEDRIKSTLTKKLDSARQEFGLTDAGFDMMVQRMKETGNFADPNAAAAYIVAKAPPQNVRGPTVGPQSYDPYFGLKDGDERRKRLHRDPERFRDEEIGEFLSDPDRYLREYQGAGL